MSVKNFPVFDDSLARLECTETAMVQWWEELQDFYKENPNEFDIYIREELKGDLVKLIKMSFEQLQKLEGNEK